MFKSGSRGPLPLSSASAGATSRDCEMLQVTAFRTILSIPGRDPVVPKDALTGKLQAYDGLRSF